MQDSSCKNMSEYEQEKTIYDPKTVCSVYILLCFFSVVIYIRHCVVVGARKKLVVLFGFLPDFSHISMCLGFSLFTSHSKWQLDRIVVLN